MALSNYDNTILATAGLIAYWPLNEANGSGTVADATGNGHTGTVGSGITLGAASLLATDSETAATFPGGTTTADDITIGTSAAFSTTGPVTVEAWIKQSAWPNNRARIFNVGGAGGGYACGVTSVGDMIATSYGHTDVISSQVLAVGSTYYVVYVVDPGNGHVLFYVNGALADTKALSLLTAASATIAIGNAESTEDGIHGVLQKVAVYNAAVPASTISAHWNAGSPQQVPALLFGKRGRTLVMGSAGTAQLSGGSAVIG